MSTPVRVGAFAVGLVVLFGAAFGVGRLFEDDDQADAGYSLRVEVIRTPQGTALELTVTDPDGRLVDRFATRHEKQIHLVAVRKDFGGYRHVHPALEASGRRWLVPSVDLTGGEWRLFADFQPVGGAPTVLHQDVRVIDALTTAPQPASMSLRQSVDGYDVDLAWAGSGTDRQAIFTVSRRGEPITDLQPYLGAYGHLVALSDPALEFQHVHPEEGPSGPAIAFRAPLDDAGRYRLYLEFQHRGVVHTVAFATTSADDNHEMDEMDHGDH